jgi:hypothetical protein
MTDPRVERTREHSLEDILFIAIASVLCGAEGWNEMEEFGKAKEDWLKTFLHLPGKRLRDDVYHIKNKQGRTPCYSLFHMSGSNSRYFSSDVSVGSAAALLITSLRYSKKLIPQSLHEQASE